MATGIRSAGVFEVGEARERGFDERRELRAHEVEVKVFHANTILGSAASPVARREASGPLLLRVLSVLRLSGCDMQAVARTRRKRRLPRNTGRER